MCRSIKTLFNYDPPASEEEIRGAAIQFVRKISGYNKPSKDNKIVFDRAVEEVARAAQKLLEALTTRTGPRLRESGLFADRQ